MSDMPQPQSSSAGYGPAVGALSADGSRMWNGSFWVLVRTDKPAADFSSPLPPRSAESEFFLDRRGSGAVGVVAAALVGIVLTHLHFDTPAVGPLSTVLTQILVTNLIWLVFSYGCVIAILSVGRHGVDVMLLRAMVVASLMGVAFTWLTPLGSFVSGWRWILLLSLSGFVFAVLLGPILAVWAIVANLIWYRSPRSLRPQFRILSPD